MFGFLKKKLKDAVEKISGVAKDDIEAKSIEEAEREVELNATLKEEIKEKKELIQDAKIELTPEAEGIVEKPAEQIIENQKSYEIKEAEEVESEVGAGKEEEMPGVETENTEIITEKEEEMISEKIDIENYQKEPKTEENAAMQKDAAIQAGTERMPEEVTISEIKTETGEVKIPEFRREEEAIEEEEPKGITFEKIKQEKDVPKPKKSIFEKLGMKKAKKDKVSAAKPESEPVKPATVLPPGLEIAGVERKKEENEKTTLFKKIRKAISEKTIEESDVKDILWDLQIGLIENDVAVGAAEKIAADLRGALVGRSIPKKGIEETVKNSMKKSVKEILDVGEIKLEENIKSNKPFLILFLGFNGVGKTTTIARVGHLLKKKGFNCIFAAADTWRAGAIQQIEEHGNRLDIKVIRQEYGSDPAAIIFDAKKYAEAHDIDVILADTAGRSHTNVNLIDELKKIVRVNKPDLKILVLDALTGNDVVEQTKYFNDAVGADCMIMTKADVYEKGGSILSAVHTIKKPILYLGIGQGYKDLEEFNADKIANNLLE